jgi:hypothetical protein
VHWPARCHNPYSTDGISTGRVAAGHRKIRPRQDIDSPKSAAVNPLSTSAPHRFGVALGTLDPLRGYAGQREGCETDGIC